MTQHIVITVDAGTVTWSVDADIRLLDAIGAMECAKLGMIRSHTQKQLPDDEQMLPE